MMTRSMAIQPSKQVVGCEEVTPQRCRRHSCRINSLLAWRLLDLVLLMRLSQGFALGVSGRKVGSVLRTRREEAAFP